MDPHKQFTWMEQPAVTSRNVWLQCGKPDQQQPLRDGFNGNRPTRPADWTPSLHRALLWSWPLPVCFSCRNLIGSFQLIQLGNCNIK